jgi:hydroxymethylglutaryl-CoA lyase
MKYARPGLKKVKEKFGEKPDQNWPEEWGAEPVLPEKYRPV